MLHHTIAVDGGVWHPGGHGVQGVQGVQGEQGERGERGPAGVSRVAGPKGDKGEVGEQGYAGTQGVKGERGRDGMSSLALTSALTSFEGRGVGLGVSRSEGVNTFSIAAAIKLNNRSRITAGYTTDSLSRKATNVGIGFSF